MAESAQEVRVFVSSPRDVLPEREAVTRVVQRINDEQLARIAFGDWTVSAVLAHMAFWDRATLERHFTVFRDDDLKDVSVVLADSVSC